jgi:ABC-type antimicrobial peptide transport system permease subunit
VGNLRTLAQALADALFLQRAAAGLFAFFGALGLLLAAVGISGVVAYLASTRTHEIGLRLALGATRGAILRWLLRRGLLPVAAGLAVGVSVATGATWSVSHVFAGLRSIETDALLGAVALLALVGFAAALAPAWRACALDVAAALRQD